MRFSLGEALIHRESCPSLVRLCLPISSASIGGIRQLIFQIPGIDLTLMGYCISVQVRTMMRSVMCKSSLRMGENILRRFLMMPYAVLLSSHLSTDRSISLLGSDRGRVDGIGDVSR